METNTKIKRVVYYLVFSLIIFLLTFPKYEPSYGTGLDPSYVWALNHLFSTDYDGLTQLIYPIGPLGFLKYSAAYDNNLAYALFFFSVFKLVFIFLLLQLCVANRKKYSAPCFLFVLIASYFAGFDLSILGIIVIALLLYLQKDKSHLYFILANLMAAIGLLIKSSIGISAYSVIFSYYFLYIILQRPPIKNLLIQLALSLGVSVITGVVAFKGFVPFYNFLVGTVHLAGGYSSGLALFPQNNWWLLSGFIILMLSFPFVFSDRGSRRAWLLLLLPLFATWKLAMGREDVFHYSAMIGFLFVFWTIILANANRLRIWIFLFPVLTVLLFYINMGMLPGSKEYRINFSGPINFSEAVLNYSAFNEEYKVISEMKVSKNKLENKTRVIIGKATIDIYPWDLSYAAANQLNWVARKTLELGASTSAWLSAKSASHYNGDKSPDFVLFHLKDDKWGGKLGSIDGRYILNDEPLVIENLLRHYKIRKRNDKFLLFEKLSKESEIVHFETMKQETGTWNVWIPVPEPEHAAVRLKVEMRKNFFGHLKMFLYKDEAYFIDYRMADSKILSFRLLASTAIDGLWINPFVKDPSTGRLVRVKEIRLRCSNLAMTTEELPIIWEQVRLDSTAASSGYFWNEVKSQQEYLFQSVLDYQAESPGWHKKSLQLVEMEPGKQIEEVSAKGYSSSFTISVDSIFSEPSQRGIFEAGLAYLFRGEAQKGISLVISMQGTENDYWKSFPLDPTSGKDDWKYAFKKADFQFDLHKGGILKVYLWNNSTTSVFIDDFSVAIYSDHLKTETEPNTP